ncbi:protein-L-isoaspartate O-methyltransferase family protein [Actinomadura atramentaria]|uniref:protein-L-isoaspartate O-methyltransferase family protein n=1 Tax=Actinomadura atramentaria TaxID=1990 RepID=UPI0003692B34|nr:methyltransferase domain-containing protein [Actinomadura atramentaria]
MIDRRDFIPDRVYHYPSEDADLTPLERQDDPDRWNSLVASGDPVITRLRTDRLGMVWPSSSASALWVVRAMLDALAIEPGMTVLEIGTGTGYNAALMADAGARVVSVEIVPDIADAARTALERTGFADRVTVLTADGENGAPDHAPFDRVTATAGAQTVPYAWVEQTRDGGRIVVPYMGMAYAGALIALDVANGIAQGRAVCDRAHFMPLRGQTDIQPALRATPAGPLDRLRFTVTQSGQTITFTE